MMTARCPRVLPRARWGRSHRSAARIATPAAALIAAALSCAVAPPRAAAETVPRLDAVMFEDPALDLPAAQYVFSEQLLPLWIVALRNDEADLKQQAAFTIAWAVKRGLERWSAAVPPLVDNLTRDSRRLVRLASARALVGMGVRETAAKLHEQSQRDGLEMAQIVEPALAEWGFQPIRSAWRERLLDPRANRPMQLLAIRGLGSQRDAAAAPYLQEISLDADAETVLRLAAAEALGRIQSSGLEDAARSLIDKAQLADPVDLLLAARLLRGHDSEPARSLLGRLAGNPQSSAAAVALERLMELDPAAILPVADQALAQGDVNVRRLVADALFACPSTSSVARLGGLLGDPHPDLRRHVCEGLVQLAEDDQLRAEIVRQGARALSGDDWRGLEQGLRLLARLDQEQHAGQFVELLRHRRAEVYVTAAWALRTISVAETCPPMLALAQERYAIREQLVDQPEGQGLDAQLSQILQCFGQLKYREAEAFLRSFVPKAFELGLSRGAAVWALGYLYEGQPDEALVAQLEERLQDVNPPEAEVEIVRRFAAVSLGRMEARQALPTLRKYRESGHVVTTAGYACAWSVQRLTGESFEPPQAAQVPHLNFFLEPNAEATGP